MARALTTPGRAGGGPAGRPGPDRADVAPPQPAAASAPPHSGPASERGLAALALACLALAGLSLLLPSTPTYDPWAWLLWGREIAHLHLSTVDGPSWKPLPVLFTTAFSLAGGAAPALWLVVSRAGALLAAAMAWRLGRRLGGPVAGTVAAVGLVLSAGWVRNAALGNSEGLLVAAALLAVERHLDGRRDHALWLGFAAALLRPESWPFLGLYALYLWWAEPPRRRLVLILLALVPVLWLGPELWGSGSLLRSSTRAHVATRFSPVLTERPGLDIARLAWVLVMLPIRVGAVAAVAGAARALVRRRDGGVVLVLAIAAAAWVAIVAAMTQSGYAGNQRYLVLPAAIECVLGGVGIAGLARAASGMLGRTGLARASGMLGRTGLVRAASGMLVRTRLARTAAGRTGGVGRGRPGSARLARARPILAVAIALAIVVPFAALRVPQLSAQVALLGEENVLNGDLARAVTRVGGPAAVRSCGTPIAGPYQVPVLAWLLDVPVGRVRMQAGAPGMAFHKRAAPGRLGLPSPADGFRPVASVGRFDVLAACRGGRPLGSGSVRAASAPEGPVRR